MRTMSLVLLSVGLCAHLTAGEAIAESKPAATPAPAVAAARARVVVPSRASSVSVTPRLGLGWASLTGTF